MREDKQTGRRFVEKIQNIRSCKDDGNTSKYCVFLDISVDALRNWEMNGLMTIKRKQNGYRIYTDADIRQLKIIRVLRCANYSLAAITIESRNKCRKNYDYAERNERIISFV